MTGRNVSRHFGDPREKFAAQVMCAHIHSASVHFHQSSRNGRDTYCTLAFLARFLHLAQAQDAKHGRRRQHSTAHSCTLHHASCNTRCIDCTLSSVMKGNKVPFAEVMQRSSGLLISTNRSNHRRAQQRRPLLQCARKGKFEHVAQIHKTNELTLRRIA